VVSPLEQFAGPAAEQYEPVSVWDHVKGRAEDYLAEYGRPDQVTAWREGKPYVADLSETSAGQ